MAKHGTLEQWREYLTLRSVYHLKEGDPHTLRHPPAQRPDQGGDGRDPGRRVRRRVGRAHAQRAVRRPDARPRPGRRLRRALGRRPGGRLRVGQHDVAVRPAPALAGRGGRAPDRGGDDLVASRAGGTRPACGGSASTSGRRSSTTSTWRPTPSTSRSPSVDMCGSLVAEDPDARRRRPVRGAPLPGHGRSSAQHLLGAWEAGRSGLRRTRALAPWPPGDFGTDSPRGRRVRPRAGAAQDAGRGTGRLVRSARRSPTACACRRRTA